MDKNGNLRFAEGNGQLADNYTDYIENVSYNKWSLSGSHLMLVVAGRFKSSTPIPQYFTLATYDLPSWVYYKIYSLEGRTTSGNICRIDCKMFTETVASLNSADAYLMKATEYVSNCRVFLNVRDNFTTPSNEYVYFRAQVDLIIDQD